MLKNRVEYEIREFVGPGHTECFVKESEPSGQTQNYF